MQISMIGHEIEKGGYKPYKEESLGYAFLAFSATVATIIIFALLFI